MLLTVAQREARQTGVFAPLELQVSSRLPDYFGLTVEGGGERLVCEWGEWRPSQQVAGAGAAYRAGEKRPSFQVRWTLLENGLYHCRVMGIPEQRGEKAQVLVESTAPGNWELTDLDIAAWGFYAGIEIQSRRAHSARRKSTE